MNAKKDILIALVGNPNSGKTTIFNALTGANQKVGNYPGVTVEKIEGHYTYKSQRYHVVDLPGIYSISAYSSEELITRTFLAEKKPALVVNILDSSNLERNLYLTVQLMELGHNMVVVFNMADELQKQGRAFDLSIFSQRLQCPIVETIGHRSEGIEQLKNTIIDAIASPQKPAKITYHAEVEEGIANIQKHITPEVKALPYEPRYLALKLLEHDDEVYRHVMPIPSAKNMLMAVESSTQHLKAVCRDLPDIIISEGRYGFAAGVVREACIKTPVLDRVSLSERIDAVVTHPIFAFPIFFLLMYLLFWLVFSVGEIPMKWIENLFQFLVEYMQSHFDKQSFITSFFTEAIIGGVGGVLVFLPNILLLFLGIAFLEDTGYIARAAFIMDKIMHKIGLHGKSFIPMLIGFGCTVPGILATRTLENRRDRLTTMLVLPLMSCGARFPIYVLIIPAFFTTPWVQSLILWGIYIFGILLAGILAKLIRSTILKGEDTPFVMELPPYRIPTLWGVIHHMWQRTLEYVKKAGTIILFISIVIWLASQYPKKNTFEIDKQLQTMTQEQQQEQGITQEIIEYHRAQESLEYSLVGRIGYTIEPIFRPMGFDGKIATALIGAFAAKEVFVAQLGVIFSVGETETGRASLQKKLQNTYTPLVGICILIFCLIASPCMGTVAVMRRESGSWGWAMLQFWGLTIIGYIITTIVYQLGSLFL
ncbi:MAG TPA: ferrous iron transport protein B [Planctomycetota bacterium]|nr:ferrous iron transport protein B [Planctomycetota bacterium]HRU52163.1 ferrous iron transport protein B [Planctomycetota bacterium]